MVCEKVYLFYSKIVLSFTSELMSCSHQAISFNLLILSIYEVFVFSQIASENITQECYTHILAIFT